MKKAVALLLAGCCLFGLAGCGGGEDTPDPELPTREEQPLVGYNELGLEEIVPDYIDSTFFSENNDAVTYVANALWDQFGLGTGGAVAKLGSNSSWLYWDAVKASWYAAGTIREEARNVLIGYPQREDGFLWSWGSSETWGGAGYNNNDSSYTPVYHYDQMFNYINAVKEYCAWENSTALLSEVDSDTAQTQQEVNGIQYNYDDSSQGRTVLQKTELALNYILTELNGNNGLIIVDNGQNTGELGSGSSNYWDNLCFGYKDAYEGALFLGALGSMADIYQMLGEEQKEADIRALLQRAQEQYDETYWDAEKGRYISTVSQSGKKYDFGFTFLNTEALYYGAGDAEKAESIFSWIDGARIVEGDTLTGLDILDTWNIAPASNTVPVESVKEMNEEGTRYVSWWHAPSGINVYTNSKYGLHCENGGAIFYTAYFELMSRIKYGMEESALQRMITISKEYAEDKLLRDPINSFGSAWVLGVIGEFPESGMVPVTYLRGFMGVNAEADGLHIVPNLPQAYKNMGANDVYYAGKALSINIVNGSRIEIVGSDDAEITLPLIFSDFAGKGSYTVTVTDEEGTSAESSVQKREDGTFAASVTLSGRSKVTIG